MAVGTDENVMKKERDVSVRHLSLALVSGVFTHYSHLHHLLSDSNDHYCFHLFFNVAGHWHTMPTPPTFSAPRS